MNKNNPSEVLKSWSSVPGHLNLLILAPGDAPYLSPLLALGETDHPFEVLQLEDPDDALRLLSRAQFSVVVLEAKPFATGYIEVVWTGLAQVSSPIFLFMCDPAVASSGTPGQGAVRTISRNLPGAKLSDLVIRTAAEQTKARKDVLPSELLRAASSLPDDYWLRISERGGGTADLCVSGGRALYCETGKLAGEAASRHLLSWGACTFEGREYPAFLRGNMDRDLATLLDLPGAKDPACEAEAKPGQPAPEPVAPAKTVWQMPPVSDEGTSPETREPPAEVEEPAEIPVLAAVAPRPEEAEPVFARDWTDEPDEPMFDPDLPEPEIVVEEPLDLFMDGDGGMTMDDPSLPEFSEMALSSFPPAEALRSEVFVSFAILGSGGWELEACYPNGAEFDVPLLKDVFARAIDCAERHGLGPVRRTLIHAGDATLALAQAPGTERLLVARTRDRFFGELEESELMRLLEAVAVTASTVSV